MPSGTPHDDEEPYLYKLSGSAYVSARLKVGDADASKLRIRAERTCYHLHTICLACARMWSQDWYLYWNATSGGRDMRAAIAQRDGIDPSEVD